MCQLVVMLGAYFTWGRTGECACLICFARLRICCHLKSYPTQLLIGLTADEIIIPILQLALMRPFNQINKQQTNQNNDSRTPPPPNIQLKFICSAYFSYKSFFISKHTHTAPIPPNNNINYHLGLFIAIKRIGSQKLAQPDGANASGWGKKGEVTFRPPFPYIPCKICIKELRRGCY